LCRARFCVRMELKSGFTCFVEILLAGFI